MLEVISRPDSNFNLLTNSTNKNDKLAIFIHGFLGNYLTTWGKLPDFLRINADSEAVLDEWDFLFLGYSTWKIKSYLDISDIILANINNASKGNLPFPHKYKLYSLFGHSLGTLGIRQLLCNFKKQPSKFTNSLKSISFFGTPHQGSVLAHLAPFIPISGALKPRNPQLRMLKNWSDCSYSIIKWPNIYIWLGLDDKVVGHTSSDFVNWDGDLKPPFPSTFDHAGLVKPKNWNNSELKDHLINVLR